MTRKTKYRLAGILAVVLIGFTLLNILAYNQAHAMMFFTGGGSRTQKPEKLTLGQRIKVLLTGVNVPRPMSTREPSELDSGCSRLSVRAPGGVTLGCWYVDRGDETPLVILFHGYGAEKTCLIPQARVFLQLGMSVLLVDFRGSGESSESYATIGFREADDVAAVMRHARFTLHHPRVVLYGQSMGAVAILRAVHEGGIQPDAVIVEAVFDTMLNTVRHRFQAMRVPSFPSAELLVFWGGVLAGFNAFSHNPVEYAKAVACPVLFMHGADDPRARLEEGRRVYDAVPGLKQFKEFPSIGHEAYVSRYPREWSETVKDFLKRVADPGRPVRPLLPAQEIIGGNNGDDGTTTGTVRVAAIQCPSVMGMTAANMRNITNLVRQAALQGARIVVLPECAVQGYMDPTTWTSWSSSASDATDVRKIAESVPGSSTLVFSSLARELGVYLCIGLVESASNRFYNSQVLLDPHGKVIAHHRKKALWTPGDSTWCSVGDLPVQVVDTEYGRIGLMICFDFHVLPPLLAKAKADIVLYSVGWYGPNEENWFSTVFPEKVVVPYGYHVVAANWTSSTEAKQWPGRGHSCVINRDGRVLAMSRAVSGNDIVFGDLVIKTQEIRVNGVYGETDMKR